MRTCSASRTPSSPSLAHPVRNASGGAGGAANLELVGCWHVKGCWHLQELCKVGVLVARAGDGGACFQKQMTSYLFYFFKF